MRSKRIRLPIYGGSFVVVLDNDLSYVERKYGTMSLSFYGAVTMRVPDGYKEYLVAFTDKEHLSNIVHEIVHLKNYIYEDAGVVLDLVNDEHEAYLSGWLFDEIYGFLKKC